VTTLQNVSAASIDISSNLTKLAGSNVTTSGAQSYTGNVTLSAANTTLNGTGITFNNSVDGSSNLSISDSGNTTFNGAVGTTQLLASLNVSAPNITLNNGTVKTVGAQTYNGAVNLNTTNSTLTGTDITFNSSVNGSANLTIADSGNTTFNGAVGSGTQLTSLNVTAGNITLNNGTVSTIGTQGYHGILALAADANLTGSTITTFGNVAGANHSLTITGDAVLGNRNDVANSSITNVSALTVTGATSIETGSIITSTTQTYNGRVDLVSNTTLNGTSVTVGNVVGNGNSLTIIGHAVLGNASAISSRLLSLDALSVEGSSEIGASTIQTSNAPPK
jgi:hypothetical protein